MTPEEHREILKRIYRHSSLCEHLEKCCFFRELVELLAEEFQKELSEEVLPLLGIKPEAK